MRGGQETRPPDPSGPSRTHPDPAGPGRAKPGALGSFHKPRQDRKDRTIRSWFQMKHEQI